MPAGFFFMPKHGNKFTVICHRLSCFFGNGVVRFNEPFHMCAARTATPVPSVCAGKRCADAHRLMASVENHPTGLAAMVGYYIDCHIPALLFKGNVCCLYRKGKQPEKSFDFPQTSFPTNTMTDVVSKTWHSHAHHEVLDVLVKLLRKGGPAPSSVRYVNGLLKRCTVNKTTSHVMRNMFLSTLVGGYRHSTVTLAAPDRIRLYSMSTLDLFHETCRNQTTRALHTMVSVFVCANTLENEALRSSITQTDHAYALATVSFNPRQMLRRNVKKNISSSYSVFSVMMKALNVTHTTHSAYIAKHGAAKADVIEQVVVHTKGFHTTLRNLKLIGLFVPECQAVQRCFSNVGFTSLKMLRYYLKIMSPVGRDSTALFMWYTHQSLNLSVKPLHPIVETLQRRHMLLLHGTEESAATVCHRCAALKIQVKGISVAKTKMGVSVNPDGGTSSCNACHSHRVSVIDLMGCAVHVLHKSKKIVVVLCSRCLLPTSEFETLGVFPVCYDCKPIAVKSLLTPQQCLCGRPSVHKLGWYPALRNGNMLTAGICTIHAHMLPDVAVNADNMIQEMHAVGNES